MSENILIERATKAYHQHCLRNGLICNQPDKGLSEVDGDIIVLRNRKGVIARYSWTYKGLRFVEDTDSEDHTHV